MGGPRVGGPKVRAFFPSPAPSFTLFSLSGVFSLNCGPGFEAVGHPNSALLGSFCASPAAYRLLFCFLSFFLSFCLSFFLLF